MSTLAENVAKVTAAHAALKTAIAAKGVAVPDGTKLSAMPALVEQISTESVPTNPRAVFAGDDATSVVVPKTMVVDMMSVTNLTLCFYNCSSLTSLHLPDGFGQNAMALVSCFAGCSSLTSLTLPDGFGQNATTMATCFYNCSSLTSLHLPDGFGQNAKSFVRTFNNCTALKNITGNPKFKHSFGLTYSKDLTHDSLMVVINGLQIVTTAQTISLGTTNLAKLTNAEKKVATDKGWTLA